MDKKYMAIHVILAQLAKAASIKYPLPRIDITPYKETQDRVYRHIASWFFFKILSESTRNYALRKGQVTKKILTQFDEWRPE